MSEAVAPSAPTDATMSVAKSGKRYSETVSSFHIFELPESSRKSALAPLFQQDISFPMSGPFFIEGDTAEDANQLMLRMTRSATAFTLLIDVKCTGPAAYLLDTDSQQAELEEVATHSLSHRLDDVVQL